MPDRGGNDIGLAPFHSALAGPAVASSTTAVDLGKVELS